MKRKLVILKWMSEQIRAYLLSFVLIIIMSAILALCKVGLAFIIKSLIDAAVDGVLKNAVNACVYFTIAVLIQIGLKGVISYLSVQTSENMSNQLRYAMYMHLTNVKWREYSKYHSGDILTRITSDVGMVVEGMVSAIPELISLGFGLLGAFVALFIFDPILAVGSLFLGPIVILIGYIFSSRFMKIQNKAQEAESDYRSYVQECMEHMLVLKTFCQEKESGDKFKKLQDEKKRLAIRKNITTTITGSFVTGGFWFTYLLAFGWGAMKLLKGAISFGTLTAFFQLIALIQSPFFGLAGTLPQIVSAATSAKRLMELERLEIENRSEIVTNQCLTAISFENVSFSYNEGNFVLDNISFKIHAGEMIGLIGTSGEGKTTLIHLIMQLLEPTFGKIYFHCGSNKKIAEASVRSFISYVPQGNTLFSGSISDNLKIGNPDATIDEQIAALDGANAWDFVNDLQDGLDTLVGENGLGLSEGQAQRIAIARALLRKTPLLILDEATSALDIETEKKVLKTISKLTPRRTCIMITHRPSMLEYCERVWKIESGELIESGATINEVAASEVV
ncbi:MAG: hypothetical protein K0S41_2693 [Anaerocolumna sp.]|nr:hypothetical protein [Anaerocolumna sp.]